MRVTRWILLVLVSVALIRPALAADAAPRGSAAVEAAWTKAMLANDLNGVLALYAPDALLWMPGAPVARGEKEIRAAYAEFLSANTVKSVVLSETGSATSSDVSGGWGHYEITLMPKAGGAPVVLKGRFTEVTQRRGGKWLYVADHASDDPPPAEKKDGK